MSGRFAPSHAPCDEARDIDRDSVPIDELAGAVPVDQRGVPDDDRIAVRQHPPRDPLATADAPTPPPPSLTCTRSTVRARPRTWHSHRDIGRRQWRRFGGPSRSRRSVRRHRRPRPPERRRWHTPNRRQPCTRACEWACRAERRARRLARKHRRAIAVGSGAPAPSAARPDRRRACRPSCSDRRRAVVVGQPPSVPDSGCPPAASCCLPCRPRSRWRWKRSASLAVSLARPPPLVRLMSATCDAIRSGARAGRLFVPFTSETDATAGTRAT